MVAGMEGALPSVVGGLVAVPVIAVPTSVGYGASFGGLAALLGMLNSCAAGVTVVNIDNGFGAAAAASRICRAMTVAHRARADRAAASSGSTWCIPPRRSWTRSPRRYGLQPISVQDCLDPEHLPKFEQFETYTFVIIRAFDEQRRAAPAPRCRS